MAGRASSVFSQVQLAPPIEVFGLIASYNVDPHPNKVNLSAGAYRTDEGKPWVLPVVHSAEVSMASDPTLNKEYLTISGLKDFYEAAARLFLGNDSPAIVQQRVTAVQALGGTGALRLGADFLSKVVGLTVAYITDPTWENHNSIFKTSGFDVRTYNYWNAAEKKMDFESVLSALRTAPPKSVFVLHVCAHNPTGMDPSHEQWQEIAAIMKERDLFPFFDGAYQGFATGDLENDSWAARYFIGQGFEVVCAQSFSKNFGLYNERVGNCIVVSGDSSLAAPIRSQMELLVRRMWSNPPSHGARIVTSVLQNAALLAEWKENIKTMANRIKLMRQKLYEKLRAQGTPGTWEHIVQQIGMFSYLGLSPRQCDFLLREHHIYLLKSGRISMCGLTTKNVDYVANAIHEAVTTVIDEPKL